MFSAVGWCLAFCPGAMAVSFYFSPKYHGAALGMTIAGIGMGMFTAPILVETLTDVYTWRGSLLIQAAINLNIVVFGAVLFPVAGTKKNANYMEISLLKNWIFVNFLLYVALFLVGVSVMSVHLSYTVQTSLGASPKEAALVVSTLGIGGTLGRLIHGIVSKLPKVNALAQQMSVFFLLGVLTVLIPFMKAYSLMIVVAAFMGFFQGALSVTAVITIYVVGLKSRIAGYGFFNLAAGLGMVSGAPIAGFLYDRTGNYDVSMYFGGGVIIVAVMTMIVILLTRWGDVMARYRAEEEAPEQIPVNQGTRTSLEDELA